MMQLDEPNGSFGMEDCQFAVKALETEAYSAVVSALRGRGPLGQYHRLILEHLRLILNISLERHKSEIRRALSDSVLLKISRGLNPQIDITCEWVEEAKRTFASGNYASSLVLDTPSVYRFNFLRSSKNDSLLALADSLAYLAAEHNRSKSVENGEAKMFEALKKPKIIPPAVASTKNAIGSSIPFGQEGTPSMIPEPMADAKKVSMTAKKRSTTPSAAAISPKVTSDGRGSRKSAGRKKDATGGIPAPKQRLGQLIAARSVSAFRRIGGQKQKGRGGKGVSMASAAPVMSPHFSPQRRVPTPLLQQQIQLQKSPHRFYPVCSRVSTSTSLSHQIAHYSTRSPRLTLANHPGASPERQVYRRTVVTGPSGQWPTMDPKLNSSCAGRVPVSPLSMMLPVSTGSTCRTSGIASRFNLGPSSPTRPSLSGEAPGVYADNYNANTDLSDPSAPVRSSPDVPMQPRHFFSSLSATYFAQNSPPPVKLRRVSPAALGQNAGNSVASGTSRITGITVKPKSAGGLVSSDCAESTKTTSASVSPRRTSTHVPVTRLDPAPGQKVIVLPSSIIRRAQQQQTTTASPSQSPSSSTISTSSQSQDKQHQSLIILRRPASSPHTPSVVSPSTTPVPGTAATSPTQSREEAK